MPSSSAAQARLLVAAAISFIEDVARTWHLTRYAGVEDEITDIAMSILTS
ncbi:TetR family transcriptional regulator [Mycobacterium tuberculosis]|nr:TetR family transcriptional regulator [Mycobacterium tuberculosis]